MTNPLVSCLMVTRDRAELARRALHCFAAQSWQDKELVIIDDGNQDYEPMLAPYREAFEIRYVKVPEDPEVRLGGLRNRALDEARGEFCIQWDDDEWYHPERIAVQMRAAHEQKLDAVVLKWTLMHMDTPDLVEKPYRADAGGGTPGTILHRRTKARYPNLRRAEDSEFLDQLRGSMRVGVAAGDHSHLFIRCFHGDNTWDARHFLKRLRRTPAGLAHYLKARLWDRDIFRHPAFLLGPLERQAVTDFLAHSRQMGLLRN